MFSLVSAAFRQVIGRFIVCKFYRIVDKKVGTFSQKYIILNRIIQSIFTDFKAILFSELAVAFRTIESYLNSLTVFSRIKVMLHGAIFNDDSTQHSPQTIFNATIC